MAIPIKQTKKETYTQMTLEILHLMDKRKEIKQMDLNSPISFWRCIVQKDKWCEE